MYKVKDGKIIWEYFDTAGKGRISDAILMSDSNILIAHQYGIQDIAENNVVWSMNTPKGYEINFIHFVGKNM